jgi:membrane-bound lytic murein transglycosylase B
MAFAASCVTLAVPFVASGFSRTSADPIGVLHGPPEGGHYVQEQTQPDSASAQTQADAQRPSFSEFLARVRDEALSRGIRPEIVEAALANIEEPLPIVIERDRAQAEAVLSLETYIARRLTAKRIRTGREMMARHRDLLARVADTYGVPARIIVAVWGVESEYGRLTGIRPTIAALATLAWDPRRSTLFRTELFRALEILNRGDIEPAQLRGSWAGAMGQPQFMPSSYLLFAEDFNGDGRKDIWSTPDDVFASIANYLKGHGWSAGDTWGREVKVEPEVARRIANDVAPRDGSCRAIRDMTVALPLKQWQALGVRLPNGRALPTVDLDASLVAGTTRHFLVYRNYDALLDYNCANAYALGVALLGDGIAGPAPVTKPAPAKQRAKKRSTQRTPRTQR